MLEFRHQSLTLKYIEIGLLVLLEAVTAGSCALQGRSEGGPGVPVTPPL